MSGVELRTIADYQAAIKTLDRNKPEDRAKIQEYTAKIGELLKNEGKVETTRGELNISEEMGFTQNNKIAGQDKIDDLNQYNKKEVGKDQARANVKEKFGKDALDKDAFKAKEKELKAEEKKLKELNKQLSKLKFDKNNPEAYNTAQKELNAQIQEQSRKVATLQKEMVDLEADRTGASKKFAKKYEKAARQNVEQYEKTQDVVEAFLDKADAKQYEKENPGKKAAVLNENDMRALTSLYYKGVDEIKKAEDSGDEAAIKAAHDKYDDYTGIFEKDDKGEPNFSKINTRKVQNILVDKSGGDQNFNLDEVDVMSKDLGMKKSQIKHLAKEFGFGTESQLPAKFKAAGVAAGAALAGNAIGTLFGTTHSHKTAEASATAQGETVQGEVNWIASNGEEFYKFYEAKGGDAAVSVVSEACAKIPLVGQLAGPVLAGTTAFFLTKGATDDVFAGANAEKVLDNIGVAKKEAQPVLKQIRDMEITGDPKRDAAIKAAVIKASIGEDTKACNLRELQSALSDLEATKDAIGKIEDHIEEQPVPPEPPVPPTPPEPTKPEKTVGWDRDHGLLKKHGKEGIESNPEGKKNVQIIIGETKVTGDYEKPDTIEIKDNTDGRENTFRYRRVTDDEVQKGQLADGTKLTGLEGKNGPFYVMTEAVDAQGRNIKRKNVEVKQLELQKSEDGKTYDYRLEQYEGMNGYNDRSVTIDNNAKGTAPTKPKSTAPADKTGKGDKADKSDKSDKADKGDKSGKADKSGKGDKADKGDKAAKPKVIKGANGYSVEIGADGKKVYKDNHGKVISADEFKKKCPSIYKSVNKPAAPAEGADKAGKADGAKKPAAPAKPRVIKGANGYSVEIGADGKKVYKDNHGKVITPAEFQKKCPNLYKSVNKPAAPAEGADKAGKADGAKKPAAPTKPRVIKGANGYSVEIGADGKKVYKDNHGKVITPAEFQKKCPNLYKSVNKPAAKK